MYRVSGHHRGLPGAGRLIGVIWVAPLLLFSADAVAWGLYTHMYFTQLLIWLIPVADPRFRNAIRRFPELCLAATCLPGRIALQQSRGEPHPRHDAPVVLGVESAA